MDNPLLVCLTKGYGTKVKCLSMLARDTNDDGDQTTAELCMCSWDDDRALACSAGEARGINCASGISYHMDEAPTEEELEHVQEWWQDKVHGQPAVKNPDYMILICTLRSSSDGPKEVCNGPRFNTAPGTKK